MTLPVLTGLAFVFIIWINYEIFKNNKLSSNDSQSFWNREKASNFSRKTDLSDLNYITITTEQLPMKDQADNTANSYRDILLKSSGKIAVNLSCYTNTELKVQFGTANLNQLMEYDNNYTVLVSILHKWAERLYDLGCIEDAVLVLEYASRCLTDVPKSYQLLAKLYKIQGRPEKIEHIIHIIPETLIHDKEKLIYGVTEIMNS